VIKLGIFAFATPAGNFFWQKIPVMPIQKDKC